MLVLSRKAGEEIIIGDDISVKIISVQNGIVKMGLEAPKDKVILRAELKAAVSAENERASAEIIEDFEALHKKIAK